MSAAAVSKLTGMATVERGFDRAIFVLVSGIFGTFLTCAGAVMTALAYTLENLADYHSLAELSNLQTDIAGPVLLSIGGSGLIACVAMVTAGFCATPQWAKPEPEPERDIPRTVDIEGVTYHTGNGPRY